MKHGSGDDIGVNPFKNANYSLDESSAFGTAVFAVDTTDSRLQPDKDNQFNPKTLTGLLSFAFKKGKQAVTQAPEAVTRYFMDAPANDYRSIPGKIRDAVIAVTLNPNVHFNMANVGFNIANGNLVAAKGFMGVTAVSAVTSAVDSWKNRASSSSYIFNAGIQAAGGLSYLPMFAVDPLNAAKGVALYGVATAAHSFRAIEEVKAFKEKIPIDEYQKAYGTAATYSGTYYSLSELIAINAHEPNAMITAIAGVSVFRALNDQKAWDMHPEKGGTLIDIMQDQTRSPIDKIKDSGKWVAASATAPRLAAVAYGGAAVIAGHMDQDAYALAFAGWGLGNANLDLIRPKVEKLIKHIYANDPEQVEAAMTSFQNLDKMKIMRATLKIQEKTEPLIDLIQQAVDDKSWDAVAAETIRLLDEAEPDSVEQMLYLNVLEDVGPASKLARRKLKTLDLYWEDTRSPALLGDCEPEYRELAPAL